MSYIMYLCIPCSFLRAYLLFKYVCGELNQLALASEMKCQLFLQSNATLSGVIMHIWSCYC